MLDKDQVLSVYRLTLAQETLANAKMCLENHFSLPPQKKMQ